MPQSSIEMVFHQAIKCGLVEAQDLRDSERGSICGSKDCMLRIHTCCHLSYHNKPQSTTMAIIFMEVYKVLPVVRKDKVIPFLTFGHKWKMNTNILFVYFFFCYLKTTHKHV